MLIFMVRTLVVTNTSHAFPPVLVLGIDDAELSKLKLLDCQVLALEI